MRSLCVLLFACGGGKAAPPAAAPSSTLPSSGECRSDLRADAQQVLGGTEPADGVETSAVGDLDGDGVDDQIVTVIRPGETAHVVYLMRGACGHYAGTLGGARPARAEGRTGGVVDLTTIDNAACEGAPCGCAPGMSVYRWSGTAYAQDAATSTAAQETACPEGD